MTHQIIRMSNPDPSAPILFAIFSTGVNRWVQHDMTAEEVIEYYRGMAARNAAKHATQTVADILVDPALVYAQFALTFQEANDASVASGGEDLIHCGLKLGEMDDPSDEFGRKVAIRCEKPRGHPDNFHAGSATVCELGTKCRRVT